MLGTTLGRSSRAAAKGTRLLGLFDAWASDRNWRSAPSYWRGTNPIMLEAAGIVDRNVPFPTRGAA